MNFRRRAAGVALFLLCVWVSLDQGYDTEDDQQRSHGEKSVVDAGVEACRAGEEFSDVEALHAEDRRVLDGGDGSDADDEAKNKLGHGKTLVLVGRSGALAGKAGHHRAFRHVVVVVEAHDAPKRPSIWVGDVGEDGVDGEFTRSTG